MINNLATRHQKNLRVTARNVSLSVILMEPARNDETHCHTFGVPDDD